MSFTKMVNILQEINKGKIVFIQCGAFYIAKGRDAVLLSNTLGLKVTCMEERVCKIGIPINSLEKYLKKLEKLKYAYVVYNYNNKENKLTEKAKRNRKENTETNENKNCLLTCRKLKIEDDKYLIALEKFYEERRIDYEG